MVDDRKMGTTNGGGGRGLERHGLGENCQCEVLVRLALRRCQPCDRFQFRKSLVRDRRVSMSDKRKVGDILGYPR